MPEYNHNKTNSDSYKENLETWERDYTKVKNIKLDKDFVKEIQSAYPIRAALLYSNPKENLTYAYTIAKSCIALGLKPSSVCITNLNECYSTIRGFGDQAKVKNKIFNEETKLLIIEQVRPNRPTDVQDNVNSFMSELSSALLTRDNLGIIFVGESVDSINFASKKTNPNWSVLEHTNIEIYKDSKVQQTTTQKKLGKRLKLKAK